MKKIKVVLADDHAVVRMGFRLLLQDTDDIEVIGEAKNGEEAIKICTETKPNVLVMDLSMPGMGGLEAIGRILSKKDSPKSQFLNGGTDLSLIVTKERKDINTIINLKSISL